MKLTWYGHSCFALENDECRIIFDPYKPGYVPGVDIPADIAADAVLCSHAHGDHNWSEGVKLSGREVKAQIKRVPTFHDEQGGKQRGNNLISVVEMDGMRIAHFGDLGHILSDEQVSEIGKLDVIMMPIGGYYTIDARQALENAKKFAPTVIVPMHYRGSGFGFKVLGTVEDYAELCGDAVYAESNEIVLENIKAPATVILRCPKK